jgi:phosphoglycerol transferase MdoB-like AlkP superfamily enzyme
MNIKNFFNKPNRWGLFYSNLQNDLKYFIYMWLLIMFFRLAFLLTFRAQLEAGTPFADFLLTLYYGGRISLKSAGAMTIAPFIFTTLLQLASPGLFGNKVRLYWGYFTIAAICLLYQFRVPYYMEFGNVFDIFLFNTFNDDVPAIINTAIKQYHAVQRVIIAAATAFLFGFLYKKHINLKTFTFKKPAKISMRVIIAVLTACLILCFAFLSRFGGAFAYKKGIYWKNAARMGQHVLNEAVYDDIQALYRAKKTYEYIKKDRQNITRETVKQAASALSGKEYTMPTLATLFEKTAKGAKIQPPKHIFLIVGETYMLWPLLPEHAGFKIAEGVKAIINKDNGTLVKNFLPASNGTMSSVAAIILGMPDMGLYPSFRPPAQNIYETSLALQMKNLGYETRFLYGGFQSWENVASFAKVQGFDEVHFYGSLNYPKNAWGIEDKYFFEEVNKTLQNGTPTFNFILTSSNHPPLTVKIEEDKLKEIQARLPQDLQTDKDLIIRLAHFEYADKYIADFIEETYKKYPDSIFILTGDHAQRWHYNPNASVYEKIAVPFILYGKAVNKGLFDKEASGSHIDISPTLIELIAPKGAKYHALASGVAKNNAGIHTQYWLYNNTLSSLTQNSVTPADDALPLLTAEETEKVKKEVRDKQAVSYWRVAKGPALDRESI